MTAERIGEADRQRRLKSRGPDNKGMRRAEPFHKRNDRRPFTPELPQPENVTVPSESSRNGTQPP
jgi:hypothetical protein